MIVPSLDMGQIIISILLAFITIIGWFIKKDIAEFVKRLDRHDVILFEITATMNRLLGLYEASTRIKVRETDKRD